MVPSEKNGGDPHDRTSDFVVRVARAAGYSKDEADLAVQLREAALAAAPLESFVLGEREAIALLATARRYIASERAAVRKERTEALEVARREKPEPPEVVQARRERDAAEALDRAAETLRALSFICREITHHLVAAAKKRKPPER